MNIQNYSVTQNYGFDPSYPTLDHIHKGIDYGCPMNTPVIVNGVQIGLSGNTGYVTGPHLHVGRWVGGSHTNPGVGNGFNFGSAVVTELGEDNVNGKFVRVAGDGASWVYLHLSQQTCHVGQVLAATTAPAPVQVVHPYTIEHIAPKQVRLNKTTHRWGMNYDNFTAINNNPEGNINEGTIITVSAIIHHNIGYQYYLEDPNVPSGYNVIDCDDYTPPTSSPPPAPVAPSTPAPLPTGPLTAPSSDTYEVIKDIPGYISSNMAINHIDPKVTIPVGTYFIFNRRDPAINVTKTPGIPGAWINPSDNVFVEPEPEPESTPITPEEIAPTPEEVSTPDFAETFKPFPKPELYVAMRELLVPNLLDPSKISKMEKYDVTWIAGSFVKDSVEYALPSSAKEKDLWYGIEWIDRPTNTVNLELHDDIYSNKTTLEERRATKTLRFGDHFALGYGHLKHFVLGFTTLLSKIRPSKAKK